MNEIVLTERLKDDYKSLPFAIQKKLKKQIKFLAENPKHQSLQIHRIEGTRYWEFYVDISYRCVFRQDGNTYFLLAVGHHKVVDEFSRK
jgi:mRNA-degrading endonuclease RelE of RelBE toxin-antitoxin system